MQVLLREIHEAGDGSIEFRDHEYDGSEVRIGSAPDCAIQIIGPGVLGHHASLKSGGRGLTLRCEKGANALLNGESVTTAQLAPGTTIDVGGNRLTLIEAPAGFDAGIEIRAAENVDASVFEAAFVTDLEQTWLSRRRPAWLLTLLILALGLGLPLAVHLIGQSDWQPWWTTDEIWSSGPLLPAHAVAIGDDCSACHVNAFERVRDAQCTTCHVNMPDHATEPLQTHVGLADTRCATCHKEHNEPIHITVSADALCTDCHARPDWPDNRLAEVTGFTETGHPTFDADLIVTNAIARGTGFVYESSVVSEPLATAVDNSNLKYPHDVHMDPDKVQDTVTGAPLTCADCHTLDADDEHFEPITMEHHCRNCHDLKFDRRAPDRELPHGNPAEVLLTMEGHYMRVYADPTVSETNTSRRRLPDRAGANDRCEGPAYICARDRTEREAENQFTKRGCVTCHQVVVNDTSDLLGRYQVVPVRLTPDFYVSARFDHRAHLTQEGAVGDAACLDCHEAKTSSTSQDVLMPDVDNCIACHGDHRQKNLIPLHCIDCHEFHPRGRLGEGVL